MKNFVFVLILVVFPFNAFAGINCDSDKIDESWFTHCYKTEESKNKYANDLELYLRTALKTINEQEAQSKVLFWELVKARGLKTKEEVKSLEREINKKVERVK